MLRSAFLLFFIFSSVLSFGQRVTNKDWLKDEDFLQYRFYAGVNLQSFDHPFFKFSTHKYSNAIFSVNAPKNFSLEAISGKWHLGKNKILIGAYYSEADMSFSNPSSVGFTSVATMDARLMFVSLGLGLDRTIKMGKRWSSKLSLIPTISYAFMQKGLTDTLQNNYQERLNAQSAPSVFQYNYVPIMYPALLHTPWFLRLKSKAAISYRIGKHVSISSNVVYNIGLPIKMFTYHFMYYKLTDFSTPIQYEKSVLTTSSAEINIGLSVHL